jgi:hypothetical protein
MALTTPPERKRVARFYRWIAGRQLLSALSLVIGGALLLAVGVRF